MVFSLRAKEKQESSPAYNQESERRHDISYSSSDSVANPEEILTIKREETLHLSNPPNTERQENSYCLSREEPASVFIDHLGEEVEECSTDPNTGYECNSFLIKDEEEVYCIDRHDKKRIESISNPFGDGSISRQKKDAEFIHCTEATLPCKPLSRKTNTKVLQTSDMETNSKSQQRSECHWEKRGEKSIQSESGFSNSEHYSLYHARPNVVLAHEYNECQNTLKSSLLKGLPNTEQNQTSYTGTDTEKSHSLKGELIKHLGEHSEVKPYTCNDCKKSFIYKAHLLKHYRTHTGEKPCTCTFCHKRFSRKYTLKRHMRMHTGERPYKCTECGKSFTWKESFNLHRRKHIGEDPLTRKT